MYTSILTSHFKSPLFSKQNPLTLKKSVQACHSEDGYLQHCRGCGDLIHTHGARPLEHIERATIWVTLSPMPTPLNDTTHEAFNEVIEASAPEDATNEHKTKIMELCETAACGNKGAIFGPRQ